MPPHNSPETPAQADGPLLSSVEAASIPLDAVMESDAFRRGEEHAARMMASSSGNTVPDQREDFAQQQGWTHQSVTRSAELQPIKPKLRIGKLRPPTTGPVVGEDAERMLPWAATAADDELGLRMLPGVRASLEKGKTNNQQ